MDKKSKTKRQQQEINLPRLEPEIAVDVKMALVYVAGYVYRNEGCLEIARHAQHIFTVWIAF